MAARATKPNDDVVLHEGWIRVVDDAGLKATGRGDVRIVWQPAPAVRARTKLRTLWKADEGEVELAIERRRGSGRSRFGLDIDLTGPRPLTDVDAAFLEPVHVGNGRRMSAVTFDLVNFPLLDRPRKARAGDWLLGLAPKAPASDFQVLREAGGYGLTATGRIEREDGSSFTSAAAELLLDSVFHFVSFAAGAWVLPVAVDGLDDRDQVVWRKWEIYRTSPWASHLRWLPQRDQQPFIDLFAAWNERWGNRYWRDVLSRVIYFTMAANEPRADLGLTLAQAALEMLSYAICVKESGTLTDADFAVGSKKNASDRIRQLLIDGGISAAIPASLAALTSLSGPSPTGDGPAAITWLRNRLAHPIKSKVMSSLGAEMFEAWRLSVWYLEASLLSLLKYRGNVWSRVSGVLEPFV